MKGQVVHINQQRGMAAILTELDEFSIIDVMGECIEVDDELSWEGHYPCGGETIMNVTQSMPMDVFFENHGVSKNELRQQLHYR